MAGPTRPVRPPAGRAPLQSLLRFDREGDPDRGLPLYEAVVHQETAELTDHGWLDRLDAIGRLKCRLSALEAETIAGFDDSLRGVSADLGHRHPEPGDRAATAGERRWIAGDLRSVSDEIAGILEVRRGSATTKIHRACELVHNFPATLAALSEGLLTERAAVTIVCELSVLDDIDDIHAAEAAILDWAKTHSLVDIKRACQREVARRSPEATEKAHQSAHDERSVQMHTDDIGRAHLVHDHDAVDAAAVMTSLSREAVSLRRRGDSRTMDQLRNDIALRRLLPRADHTGASGGPAGARGLSPDRDMPPDADAVDERAIGADATVVIHATGAEVRALINGEVGTGGEADHHGPIPQSSLRKHLLRALAQTLLPNLPTIPTSSSRPGAAIHRPRTAAAMSHAGGSRIELQVTDEPPPSNPDRYVPSPALDRYIRLRARTCQFPGCNRAAEYTDLDHRTAFAAGGRTTAANLWCLCRHHHRLKHEGGWQIHPGPDGTYTWISPIGRSYPNNRTQPIDDR
ncbi:MAG: hypothetical protein QOH03_5115 [Kribbellaceae bacterium]|nr:hypothetical protein [Kribbellaceae bacterium]